MGSDESHFNVSLIVRDKVNVSLIIVRDKVTILTVSTDHNF